jgi:hypothetical protein
MVRLSKKSGDGDVVVAPAVARVGHLIAMILARDDLDRPQDAADLRALRAVAAKDDLELAQLAVAMIEERGFNRERDLRGALADGPVAEAWSAVHVRAGKKTSPGRILSRCPELPVRSDRRLAPGDAGQ